MLNSWRARCSLVTALLLAVVLPYPTVTGARELAAALDPASHRVLVVHDWKPIDQYGDVRARLVIPGEAIAALEIIVSAAANTQASPAVAFDTTLGRYLAVWQDDRSTLYRNEIWGQFVAADGALVGGNFLIASPADASPRDPVIGYDATAGTYLLAWVDDRNYLVSEEDIWGVVLDAGGATVGAEFAIAGEAGYQRAPALVRDSLRGRFLAVWEDHAAETWPDIRGRLLSAAGAPAGDSFLVAGSALMQFSPSPAYDEAHDRFLVSWFESDTIFSTEDDIHARLVSGAGLLLGSEIVVSDAPGEQALPSAAFDEAGDRWLVAWTDGRSINGPDIRGQYLDAAGTPTETTTDVNAVLAGSPLADEHAPAMLYDGACGFLGVAHMVLDDNEDQPAFLVIGDPCPPPSEMTVTSPNGGEIIPSGSVSEVTWENPPGTVAALVEYSLDGGATWQAAAGLGDADSFAWIVPKPLGNVTSARIRVTARDAGGADLGSDESDADFAVEVVRLTLPAAAAVLTSGRRTRIAWKTNATRKPVATATLAYSLNGGSTWLPLATLSGNPGFFSWRPPAVARPRTRGVIRLVLRGGSGRQLGTDDSDHYFTVK